MKLTQHIDGIDGELIDFAKYRHAPNAEHAKFWQFALGIIDGTRGIYRRHISEAGSYGGWRYDATPSSYVP